MVKIDDYKSKMPYDVGALAKRTYAPNTRSVSPEEFCKLFPYEVRVVNGKKDKVGYLTQEAHDALHGHLDSTSYPGATILWNYPFNENGLCSKNLMNMALIYPSNGFPKPKENPILDIEMPSYSFLLTENARNFLALKYSSVMEKFLREDIFKAITNGELVSIDLSEELPDISLIATVSEDLTQIDALHGVNGSNRLYCLFDTKPYEISFTDLGLDINDISNEGYINRNGFKHNVFDEENQGFSEDSNKLSILVNELVIKTLIKTSNRYPESSSTGIRLKKRNPKLKKI